MSRTPNAVQNICEECFSYHACSITLTAERSTSDPSIYYKS